ncbi:MAG: preprotein translocase subunit SecE [Epulopiscium sp.]|nr:preprotein translocase subunit SecE [Candidatus Epulonipiscium sp.]
MMKELFHQFRGEFKKIVWPSQKELFKQTLTVIVTSILVAGIVFVIDIIYSNGFDFITKIF